MLAQILWQLEFENCFTSNNSNYQSELNGSITGCGGQVFHLTSGVLGRIQCKSWEYEMPSPSTHPSTEPNLLSPITSWLTRVIRLRPQRRLYPLSGQMQWHKGGPDAPLSSCWPLPLFQSLRKGPEVEKVLGTGHIAALITHSVTIEPNVWPPPPGVNSFLTSRESNGASVARLPALSQDSASTSSSAALFSLTDGS